MQPTASGLGKTARAYHEALVREQVKVMEGMESPVEAANNPTKWIESTGGPFVIVSDAHAALWQGIEGDDYDEACLVEDYLGRVEFGPDAQKVPAIVVADEPLPATFLSEFQCVLQWSYAPSEEVLIDGARSSFDRIDDWHQGPALDVHGQLIMFDATVPGHSLEQVEVLPISLPAGRYQFYTADFEVGDDVAGRLHAVRPRHPHHS
ncbi:Imm21 family immunity protein [Streptomyces sp. NPDC056411]|uniref:Imm21 family immunity protein n=1 Tax=Streptomyces sp. NPDC056411 TaxID=3345813 RepID=UPI0035D82A15